MMNTQMIQNGQVNGAMQSSISNMHQLTDGIQGLSVCEPSNHNVQGSFSLNSNPHSPFPPSNGHSPYPQDTFPSNNRLPPTSAVGPYPQTNKNALCTTVTYSSQVRATYPYDKSNCSLPSQNTAHYPVGTQQSDSLKCAQNQGLPKSFSSIQDGYGNITNRNLGDINSSYSSQPLFQNIQNSASSQSTLLPNIQNPNHYQLPHASSPDRLPLSTTVCSNEFSNPGSPNTQNFQPLGKPTSLPQAQSFMPQPPGYNSPNQPSSVMYNGSQTQNLPPAYIGNPVNANLQNPYSGQVPFGGCLQQPAQQQQRLDSDLFPNAIQVRENDKKNRGGFYPTDTKGQLPPSVTTDFISQDRGICSPRFIRSTTYCLPTQPEVLKQSGVPFAVTVCPMATLIVEEQDPPLCLYRSDGPLRCKRCKAYMCPFMNFTEGGRSFQCAFCRVVNEVPQDYFCYLDGTGERTDKFHRAELCLGSYEFKATKEYCRNSELPNCPAYIFMIEVSSATFRNGMVQVLCENMKNILSCLQSEEKNGTSFKVGFVTYNTVLHFYNLKHNLTQPQVLVLSDVNSAFVPLMEGLLVSVSEAEALINSLFTLIPQLYMNEPSSEAILGPVVQVGLEALKNQNCAGKLLIFHSSLPAVDAPGKLLPRDGQKLLGTDKQKTVLNPQNDFYGKLAQECVAAGCCVDLFLFPSAYVDLASISPLSRYTGGQIYKYTYFQSHTDGYRFLEDLERNVTALTAYDAVLRVRTSAGISPVFYYGNFYMSNTTDVEFSSIDCHKAISVEMAYDDKLAENEAVCIQAALLYTTCSGERRIRVHNLAINTSAIIADLYRFCDVDTIVNFLAKQTLKLVYDQTPQQVRSTLVSKAIKMISCYRKYCASGNSSSHLVLPDSLKLLPLYINCLLKSDPLCGGPDMSLDDRSFSMVALNCMDIKNTVFYFYPTLIALHEVDPNSSGIPTAVRNSIEKLHDCGAYLLGNGIYMFLWIGQKVSIDFLQNVFGVQNISLIDKQKTCLPDLDTPLSRRIRKIVEDLEDRSRWFVRLTFVIQGDKLEIVFRHFMVEDRGVDGSPSYVEFMCHLHKEVMKLL